MRSLLSILLLTDLIWFDCMIIWDRFITCLRSRSMQCPQRPAEGVRSPGTEVTDSCKLPRGCWDLNPGSPGEQPELLTAEPSVTLAF